MLEIDTRTVDGVTMLRMSVSIGNMVIRRQVFTMSEVIDIFAAAEVLLRVVRDPLAERVAEMKE